MTQGNPLLPNIFNVVVDAVVRHCKSLLVVEQEGGDNSGDEGDGEKTAGSTIRERYDRKQWEEEVHQQLKVKAALFYSDYGLVAFTGPGWLQSSFDFLTGLFDWVGLRKNVCKTVSMVCMPCRTYGVRADKAYTHRMTREGRSFKERQRERVLCPEFWKKLAKGSLVTHRQTQHGVDKGRLGS